MPEDHHTASTEPAPTSSKGERPIRVLVVDDEPFNRMRLEDLLKREEGAELVGSAADGVEAVEMIRALKPDLVFLDVQMPGKTGLDVVREIGPEAMPATIFVTAYDKYAVEAFEVAAVDYLVKPFDDERFEQAFRRARRVLATQGMERLRQQLLAVLQGSDARLAASEPPTPDSSARPPSSGEPPREPPPAQGPPYLERLAVAIRGTVRPVSVSDIEYITASGPYVELHTAGGRQYVIREAIQSLEQRLDPARFMRIHRSIIVRLDQVEGLKRGAGGDGEVLLKNGARLRVSRTRREALERWLGLVP